MYRAAAIANYFLQKAKACGETLSPMKLMKLVYFAHGWYLGISGQPLIPEPVEAWQFGPVIASLYHQFKKFGNEPITEYAPVSDDSPSGDEVTVAFLDRIWEVYRGYTAIQLSNLSHAQGSPWYKAWHEEEGYRAANYLIPNQFIQEYYVHKLGQESKNTQ